MIRRAREIRYSSLSAGTKFCFRFASIRDAAVRHLDRRINKVNLPHHAVFIRRLLRCRAPGHFTLTEAHFRRNAVGAGCRKVLEYVLLLPRERTHRARLVLVPTQAVRRRDWGV